MAKTQDEMRAMKQLQTMDKAQLRQTVIQSLTLLGKAEGEIEQQKRVIAEMSQERQRNRAEADRILAEAKSQAKKTREEAAKILEEAERKSEEADKLVEQKLANANAEADSIVATRLGEVQHDIAVLESKRAKAKRSAISLCSNISESLDNVIAEVDSYISSCRDMQKMLDQLSTDIETEEFSTFDVNDYVTTPTTPTAVAYDPETEYDNVSYEPAPDMDLDISEDDDIELIMDVSEDDFDLNDDELLSLAGRLADITELPDEDGIPELPDDDDDELDIIGDDDFAYLTASDDDFDSLDFTEDEEEDEEDDIFGDGTMKSFTSSFGIVMPEEELGDDEFSDIVDMDFDDIIGDMDDDEEPEPEPEPAPAPRAGVSVPRRSHSRSAGSPSRWLN